MTGLGLRLTLRSGREALTRLILTTVAVGVGVTVLLVVLADYHAFEVTSRRPSWESTSGLLVTPSGTSNVELWNFSESIYQGRFIEQLSVAPLGPDAPIVPGIPKLPASGEFYASPALAALLRTVPANELGDRFPRTQVGVVGPAALTNPDQLVAIMGSTPAQLAKRAGTIRVDAISTAPHVQGTTGLYRLAFGVGAIAVLFPLLILISTATRLAAARREERYAAIRLVGGTRSQVNVLASVDAVAGAFFGTLLGIGAFLLLRPALAHIAFSGHRFFPQYVTPTFWGYLLLLVAVPLGSALASLASLRRVQISPLGVTRKTTPSPPRVWRIAPLVVGIPLFLRTTLHGAARVQPGQALLGLVLVMVGLVLSGSWLTMQGSRLLARFARGASTLLAARRLGNDPKASFRAVSGLVLAVFVGSAIAVLAPAVEHAQSPTGSGSLTDVLRVPLQAKGHIDPAASRRLIARLDADPGVTAIPIYAAPSFHPDKGPSPGPGPSDRGSFDSVFSCADLRELPVLGACRPGVAAVGADGNELFTDNPLLIYKDLPLVGGHNPASSADLERLPVSALLIKTGDAATLERVRTFLTRFQAALPGGGGALSVDVWQMGGAEAQTFGEVAASRNDVANNLERVVLTVLGLTLLVAGCSLAVTVGGSLVERKRPFTLLRVSGASDTVLRRVVMT